MEMSRVKVYNPTGGRITKVEVNGHELERGVTDVYFHVSTEETPQFVLSLASLPDIEMDGDISFRYTPETIYEAAKILQKDFTENKDSFGALVASIESSLREEMDGMECVGELAVKVAERIIGIERKN